MILIRMEIAELCMCFAVCKATMLRAIYRPLVVPMCGI